MSAGSRTVGAALSIVDVAIYADGERHDAPRDDLPAALERARALDGFVWLGLHDPSEDELAAVREAIPQDGSVEHHDAHTVCRAHHDGLRVDMATVRYVDHEEVIETGTLALVLAERLFVSVRRGVGSPLAEARRYFDSKPDLIRRGRAAALVTVIDEVIHDYDEVVRSVEIDIEQVERQIFSERGANPAERTYRLSREVAQFARAIAPLTSELDRLARGHFDAIPANVRPDFRDAHSQLLRAESQVNGARELLTSILHTNLAQIAVRQNEDMRSITAWVGILAVPTSVAGIYGMNFDHMPELHWQYGYPLVVGLTLVACSILWRRFRKAGWI